MSFSNKLNSWYRKHSRKLPWRETKDPYKIWISEIMLQQTTVNAVIPYYNQWVKKYPTVESVARAKEQSLLKSWQGLGYYSRVKNIAKAAKLIMSDHQGKIPQSVEEIKKLPGFGPYTTGAVLSIAYDKRVPIVDANVRRVFMRIMGIKGEANTSVDDKIYEILNELMPKKNLRTFNQALMELGALTCRNQDPACHQCPVQEFCKGFKLGLQDVIPTPKVKTIKDVSSIVAIIRNKEKFFIQKRPDAGLLANFWEFPQSQIANKKEATKVLKSFLEKELEITLKNAQHKFDVVHYYTQYRSKLLVYECVIDGKVSLSTGQKFVSKSQLKKYPFSSGMAKIVQKYIISNE